MKLYPFIDGSPQGGFVPTIEPRCEWVTALQSADNVIVRSVENFYGFVQEYVPVIAIVAVLALGIVLVFAVRRKVIPIVLMAVASALLLPTIVDAVGGITGTGPC
jgi:hypothetical protein